MTEPDNLLTQLPFPSGAVKTLLRHDRPRETYRPITHSKRRALQDATNVGSRPISKVQKCDSLTQSTASKCPDVLLLSCRDEHGSKVGLDCEPKTNHVAQPGDSHPKISIGKANTTKYLHSEKCDKAVIEWEGLKSSSKRKSKEKRNGLRRRSGRLAAKRAKVVSAVEEKNYLVELQNIGQRIEKEQLIKTSLEFTENENIGKENVHLVPNGKQTEIHNTTTIKVASKSQRISEISECIVNVDLSDQKNCLYSSQYAIAIHKALLARECQESFRGEILQKQMHISERNMDVVLDWLVQAHSWFRLRSETLYLGIALLQKLLSQKCMTLSRLQLYACAALWVASKFEDYCPPSISNLTDITDEAYTKIDFLDAELIILRSCNYNVNLPTTLPFTRRAVRVARKIIQMQQGRRNSCLQNLTYLKSLSLYITELAIVRTCAASFRPSVVGAAAVLLAVRRLSLRLSWQEGMERYTGWSDVDLRECEKQLESLLSEDQVQNRMDDLNAVYEKYKDAQFHGISIKYQNFLQTK